MNKAFLILSREYLVRVRRKSFLVMTFLGPLLFGGITVVPVLLLENSTEERTIHVLDQSGLFQNKLQNTPETRYVFVELSLEEAKQQVVYDMKPNLLHIPPLDLDSPDGIAYYSNSNPGLQLVNDLEYLFRNEIERMKLDRTGIRPEVIESLKVDLSVATINLSRQQEQQSDIRVASIAGYIGAFMIYFFIFYYGAQTMRGVIEEKTSRIIEVMISSVRPFQMMIGKVLGIGAVGLTQFALWVILTLLISYGLSTVMGFNAGADSAVMEQMASENQAMGASGDGQEIISAIFSQDYSMFIFAFVFYFLGGYFLYGALFAAIGSAIDHESDAQQFMLPVTMPLIFSIVAFVAILNEPNGSLAFWLSVIPFTSPIIMMMRIPFDVPLWELVLSMMMLVAGFLFTTWVAGRIYRVGILVYGTKVNYRMLAKWFFLKN